MYVCMTNQYWKQKVAYSRGLPLGGTKRKKEKNINPDNRKCKVIMPTFLL